MESKTNEEINDLKPVKNIEKWAHDQFKRTYIFYKRKGVHAECRCSECGGIYSLRTESTGDPFEDNAIDIEKPKKDEKTSCRICHRKAIYKNAGKFKNEWYENNICVGQKIDDNRFVFRIFFSSQKIIQNQQAQYSCSEIRRIFTERKKKPVRYTVNIFFDWILSTTGDNYRYKVHPSTFREIKKTGMYKYVPDAPREVTDHYWDECWVIDYYIAAARYPDMEMIVKLGMGDLANNLTVKNKINFNPRGREIHDRLRINKDKLKMLVENGESREVLKILQLERRVGKHWNSEEFEIIKKVYEQEFLVDLFTVCKYINPIKLKNYFKKHGIWYGQKKMNYCTSYQIRREYFDYISMRKSAGFDMTNEIILYPKDIRRRHNEMVSQMEKVKIDKRRAEVLAKFPKIGKSYKSLSDKYSAAAAGYIIRPAKDAAEIVDEGRILHHCVGGDNYLDKHNKGISIILLLRAADKPDEPFITVEICGENIIQWYGAYDKKPQKDYFEAWLETYVKELKRHKRTNTVKKQQKTA